MRPINLIPPEERRDGTAKLRGGPLAYILIGALAALLAGLTLLVATNNEISSSKAEIAQLESENEAAEARAAQLSAYTNFQAVHDQRVATVTQLADSRFDWERVVRELSLILPADVWLTNLTGTANPEVSVNGSAGIALRDSVPGPALEIVGCATGQEAVAGFIADLKDIDGVTRVGVESSVLGDAEEAGASSGSGEGGTESVTECQTRDFIAQFQIVAAFDAAPPSTTGLEG
jgi:type IV pilus assembly protein PilN